jgi:hypothetical protein
VRAAAVRTLAILAFAACLAAGCIQWDTEGQISVGVLVTRDGGLVTLKDTRVEIATNGNAMDALMKAALVETSYGGAYVTSIDGLKASAGENAIDWFLEVDGRFAQIGAAALILEDGQRTHWDLRAWAGQAAPGLFNTFAWHHARILDDTDHDEGIPSELRPRLEPYDGTWPEATAVLIQDPQRVDWSLVPRVAYDNGTLRLDGQSYPPPWSLTIRLKPEGTQRALMTASGLDYARIDEGLGLITTSTSTIPIGVSA